MLGWTCCLVTAVVIADGLREVDVFEFLFFMAVCVCNGRRPLEVRDVRGL